jgi:hypothetical protein
MGHAFQSARVFFGEKGIEAQEKTIGVEIAPTIDTIPKINFNCFM